MLLALTHNGEDITREQVEAVRYRDTPLVWQGLKILDACIWGVVVFPLNRSTNTPKPLRRLHARRPVPAPL